jgi:hypothetical protein
MVDDGGDEVSDEVVDAIIVSEPAAVAKNGKMPLYRGKPVRMDRMVKLFEEYGRNALDKKQISERVGHRAGWLLTKFPELMEAWQRGFDQNQMEVEGVLLKRAMGYDALEEREEKVFSADGKLMERVVRTAKVPILPDVAAMKLLLKARGGKRWEEGADVQVGMQVVILNEMKDL